MCSRRQPQSGSVSHQRLPFFPGLNKAGWENTSCPVNQLRSVQTAHVLIHPVCPFRIRSREIPAYLRNESNRVRNKTECQVKNCNAESWTAARLRRRAVIATEAAIVMKQAKLTARKQIPSRFDDAGRSGWTSGFTLAHLLQSKHGPRCFYGRNGIFSLPLCSKRNLRSRLARSHLARSAEAE